MTAVLKSMGDERRNTNKNPTYLRRMIWMKSWLQKMKEYTSETRLMTEFYLFFYFFICTLFITRFRLGKAPVCSVIAVSSEIFGVLPTISSALSNIFFGGGGGASLTYFVCVFFHYLGVFPHPKLYNVDMLGFSVFSMSSSLRWPRDGVSAMALEEVPNSSRSPDRMGDLFYTTRGGMRAWNWPEQEDYGEKAH